MTVRDEVSAEISRILQSPYVPCLKKLHDLLQTADFRTVQSWADSYACQIEGLANAVVDGLQFGPFVLTILRVLCRIRSFRDAVLRQKPMLLDTLLIEATTSEQGFRKYLTTCTSLLTAPLQVPVPSALASFLQKLVERGVHAPTAENIRPINSTLSSVGFSFLDILPLEIVVRLQSQLINILKGLEAEDHSANLLCLAVLANVASLDIANSIPSDRSCGPDATSARGQDVPQLSDRYQPARQFFTAQRASKTLDLVVLKVILSCSKNCSLRLDEIVESLKLSGEIINAVSSSERSFWRERNPAKINKLYEKILRHDLDKQVACAALDFMVQLSEGRLLPKSLVLALESLLRIPSPFVLSPKLFQTVAISLDEQSVCSILLALFQAASTKNSQTSASLASIRSAVNWVSNLDAAMKTSSSFRQRVLLSLSVKEVNEAIHQFVHSFLPASSVGGGHKGLEVCPRGYVEARGQLHDQICDFLMKTAFHASTDDNRLDLTVVLALLEKRNVGLPILPSCEYHGLPLSSASTSRPSFFEAGSTPQVLTSSHDWRRRLVEELTRGAKYQYKSILKMVGDVCQDLERRCDEAEVPLRAEEIKNSKLVVELEISQARVAELESQVLERSQLSDVLERDRNCLKDQIESFEQRVKTLSSRLTEQEQELCLSMQEAKDATEAAKQQELTYLACMTGKEELLEEQGTKLLDLQTQSSMLQNELTQSLLQETHSKENIRRLEERLSEYNLVVERLQATTASKEADIDRLVAVEASVATENHKIKTESQQLLTERDSKISELEAQAVISRREVSDLRKEHKLYSSQKAAEITRMEECHEATIKKLNEDLHESSKNAALKLHQNETHIKKLETKVKQLRRDREVQTKELTEAQEFKARLLTVMGTIGQNQMTMSLSNPCSPDFNKINQSVQEAKEASQYGEAEVDPVRSFESSTSSRSGPTPKRNKRRQKLDSPLTHPTRTVKGISTRGKSLGNTVAKSRKQPLKDLSLNAKAADVGTPIQSHSQRSQDQYAGKPRAMSKENDAHDLQEHIGDTSFGSDVFTSTNQQQLNEFGGQMSGDICDETTVDF